MTNSMPATGYKTICGSLWTWNLARIPDRDCLRCLECGAVYPTPVVMGLANGMMTHVYCCTPTGNPMAGAVCLNLELPESARIPQSDKPSAEREPVVCRWCKGAREITVNFKTKPCDCVKEDGTVGQADVGVGWTVKKKFTTSA